MRNFIGRNGFKWFVGVVEDRNDPVQIGRVRVRAFGYHTEDKGEIPTEDLPWAILINDTSSASVSGVGKSPTGIVEGSWVFGFFMDGDRAQEPAIIGTIPTMSSEKSNSAFGFNDPTEKFPRYTNESDVNRLARGNNTRVYAPDNLINEPATTFAAQYPYNHVLETESGHIREYDDTEGHERISEEHKSGTFYEIHPDGTKVQHIVANNYTVVAGDDSIHVEGNVNVYVDGNVNLKVTGNYKAEVGGTCDIISGGNMRFIAPRIDLNPSEIDVNLNKVSTSTIYGDVAEAQDAVIVEQPIEKNCPDLVYDNETAWITKIIKEVWAKIKWTRADKIYTHWIDFYKKHPRAGEVEVYVYSINKIRVEENRSNGSRTHTIIEFISDAAEFKEEIRSSIEVMAREIRANGDGEELYNLFQNVIDLKLPVYPIKRLLVSRTDKPTVPKGQIEPDAKFSVLGGGWYPAFDIMLLIKLASQNTLQTFIHEIGGHDYHNAEWGKGDKNLLTNTEVDSLVSKFTFDYKKTFSNATKIEDMFLMLSSYPAYQMEDEFLARVFSYLASNRCTTFEVDLYPILCRLGVKLSEKTVKAIDADVVNLGLNRQVPINYKQPADVEYA